MKWRVAEPWRRENSVENEFRGKVMLPEMALLPSLIDDSLRPLEDLRNVLLFRRHSSFIFKGFPCINQYTTTTIAIERENHRCSDEVRVWRCFEFKFGGNLPNVLF